MIPTKAHGALDLATGPTLLAAPKLLRMNGNAGATVPPRVVGATSTLYALLTDYEFGVRRVLPMRAHLALDAAAGVALAATPWLTGARRHGLRHWLPHAIVGVNEVLLALTTKEHPPRASRLRAWAPKGAVAAAGVGAAAAAVIAARRRTSD